MVNDNVMGEKNIFNKLIVMDNVSGLDNRSNNFANSLTVARKLTIPVSMFFTQFICRNLIGR